MKLAYGYQDQPMDVPCGQCIHCRLEKSRQWAMRIMHESLMWENNSFVTLTYDDDHLPKKKGWCKSCTNTHWIEDSICKTDVQLFLKKLRKKLAKKNIRYYACGEYGDKSKRPHYHLILFNYYPDDTKYYKKTDEGTLFTSEFLEETWGKGFVVIGEVNFETASYTARYVTKKINTTEEQKEKILKKNPNAKIVTQEQHYQGKQPEFALMSRRKGIGMTWYEKYKDETNRDDYVIMRGRKMKPPKYYDQKTKELEKEVYSNIKVKRKVKAKKVKPVDQDEYYLIDAKEKIELSRRNLFTKNLI